MEIFQGPITVDIAKRCGVEYVVYLSGQGVETFFDPPHCGVKLLGEKVVKESGIPYTILRPNQFMQNDYRVMPAILIRGVYPFPFGEIGVSRVDTRDIAEVAAVALLDPGHEGKTYTIAGPDVWTGQASADLWSRALERPVAYIDHSDEALDRFEGCISGFSSAVLAEERRSAV